jgi:hypothetical protein
MIKSELCEENIKELIWGGGRKRGERGGERKTGIGLECEQQATDTEVQWESWCVSSKQQIL